MTVDLHETTDAKAWAQAFIKVAQENDMDITDEGWLISWFANAMQTAVDRQTVVQHIGAVRGRINGRAVIDGYDGESPGQRVIREYDIALDKLDEARMWFNKGLAKVKCADDGADLERQYG